MRSPGVSRRAGSCGIWRYAARGLWFPRIGWPKRAQPSRRAATGLARRYLALHGPATLQDVAHFFGARIPQARAWLESLEAESALVSVRCGDRRGLVALAEDIDDLTVRPPGGVRAWPPRLLPLWDTMLMGHAGKGWVAADDAEKQQIWRRSAFVAAVVLDRGRAVATWSQTVKRRRLEVCVEPLGRWRATRHAAAVGREAEALARHLDLADVELSIAT